MISVLMKLSTVMAYCTGFRLLAVLAMLCATASHIYARDETWEEERFEDPNPDRVSADEIREKNRPILNNVGRKLEIEKRLRALEKRLKALPRELQDSLLASLLEDPGKEDERATWKTGESGPKGAKRGIAQDEPGTSGVNYVRWGRTTCPRGAQVVYKGQMGGAYFTQPGGGVNYLCLPEDPKYDKYTGSTNGVTYLYGTEYQVSGTHLFGKRLRDYDAPCVVCFVRSRGSMLMMPAKNDCPSGWTEEYYGYLMTNYYSYQHSNDFICVDADPEYVAGSQSNRDGALLYPVQVACGGSSLPCPPYISGRELTCAVCTK